MTRYHQLPLLLYDSTARDLYGLIRRMVYDDALVRRGWRVEYLYLSKGFPHYRLYHGGALVGLVHVRSPHRLDETQRQLAAYLAGVGFTRANTSLREYGARTPQAAHRRDVPCLFKLAPRKNESRHEFMYAG